MPRLLDHLRARGLSASAARDALATGKVFYRGVPTGDGGRDATADEVELRPTAPRLVPGRDLVILHKDEALVVVVKPSGLLSVPAPRAGGGHNALSVVGQLLGAALPVHRLDEDTSGLLLIARTPAAQLALKADFEAHTIERRYHAIVAGPAPEAPFSVHSLLVRDRGDGRRGSAPPDAPAPPDARPALTHVRRLATFPRGIALVEATLETGRTHQVRIHLAERGLPLVGDPLYAPPGVARRGPRLGLHAAVLGFRHPSTGAFHRFEAPLADDLTTFLRGLAHEPAAPPRGDDRRRRRG
jgi:23S rRNA pseudouridine1911/1915/1917 synthase